MIDNYDDERDDHHDDENARDSDSVKPGGIPESIRKALSSGISALFMTEEGIRNALSEMRLPKEAMAYLIAQTERSRKELFRAVSDELKGFLRGVDLNGELRKALTGMRLDISAQVRFVDENTIKTNVKVNPSERRHRRRKDRDGE